MQDVIEAALAGKAATYLWEGERKYAVAVRLSEAKRGIDMLSHTPVSIPGGGTVQLGAITSIRETSGAMNIAREAGRRMMAIGIFIKDRDMGSVVADMKALIAKDIPQVVIPGFEPTEKFHAAPKGAPRGAPRRRSQSAPADGPRRS